MKVKVSKRGNRFEADPVELPGSPPVGKGDSIMEALGDFLHQYRAELGVEIELDGSARDAEQERRDAALAQRSNNRKRETYMSTDYLTVVIQLPDDPVQRKAITAAVPLNGDFHGGRITAVSLEDEITVNEFLASKLDDEAVDDARREARALHAAAEQRR